MLKRGRMLELTCFLLIVVRVELYAQGHKWECSRRNPG